MPTATAPSAPKTFLQQLTLPKDFGLPFTLPQQDAAQIDSYEPTCDSLKLKKQLTTLHLQTASLRHADKALAKLVELTDSKKPEVARRACMSLLKLAHLHNTPNLLPDDEDEDFFPAPNLPTKPPKRPPVTSGGPPVHPQPPAPPIPTQTPPPFITHHSEFIIPPPPPEPKPHKIAPSLHTPLLLLTFLLSAFSALSAVNPRRSLPRFASQASSFAFPHAIISSMTTQSSALSPQSSPSPREIRRLPDALINKIAAGEVVERPASVAKELLENAIDAGASRIAIAIEDGGRTLIRITDNGHGMPPDQAPLAFAQHATSKIHSTDDLFAITTMGFRGEALASIASVSHATLTTRTPDAPGAIRIEVKDSQITPPVPCAAPVGTTLEIRDLFYSVPARRKFLRTDATEFSHIHEMVLRSALPNPHIAFTLAHNGKSVLELPPTADHKMRVAEALVGNGGKELYNDLLPIDFAERGIRITGFAGQPHLARPTAKYQYLFLNGRFIRDRALLHALKESYRGLIEPASQPVAILFIEMDPTLFDVNVHPQKTEVRFRDSGSVYRPLLAALREKLLATDLTPQVRTANRLDAPTPLPPTQSSVLSPQHLSTPSITDTRQIIADFFKQSEPTQPRLHFGVEAAPSPIDDPSRITFAQKEEAGIKNQEDGAPPTPEPSPPAPVPFPSSRFIQLHNTYLVAETPDGLVIIDQHALHERILYEELFARATRGPLEGQRLLLPEILPINPRHAAALETVRPLLAELGIEITDFDSQSIAVHSFPSLLSKVSPREFLKDLLDKLLEVGSKLTPEELLHEVLDMASCKAAVKAGYPLSQEEIAALLARKEQVDRSSNCPHGRPTTLRLTIPDLERQFKRK